MKIITTMEQFQQHIASENSFLLFVKTDNCSVCEGLKPQVEGLEPNSSIPFYLVNAARLPEIAGQLMLFTAPVVILFKHGKEQLRFARFVRMDELTKRLAELEAELNG